MSHPRVDDLRKQYPTFTYESFSFERLSNRLTIRFLFTIEPNIHFSPETVIESADWPTLHSLSDEALERFIFHLGLVEMLSYWKATCAPEIVVRAGFLDVQQQAWWTDLLLHGMREFFYVNKIDFRSPDFVRISAPGTDKGKDHLNPLTLPLSQPGEGTSTPSNVAPLPGMEQERTFPYSPARLQERDLVFVSGGKDSTLALQLLREAGMPFDCLLLNPTPAATRVAAQVGNQSQIVVRRTIDPHLLELNKTGYLNGHTPFSAYLAFLGVTCAFLFGYPRVVAANERSSDEGNVRYLETDVNHQYSKTLRFETAFRQYVPTYLTVDVEYFSVLRPLYAIQISRLFARHPQYFDSFMSCNRGQWSGAWCQRCAKCLSTFILLYPFAPTTELTRIFGADLFTQKELIPLLNELVGLSQEKPFECVGTTEEMLVALFLSVQHAKKLDGLMPVVLEYVETDILPRTPNLQQHVQPLLLAWSEEHHLPREYAQFLKAHVMADYEAH
ncbi:MAG: hypothetical protein EXR78_06075 [Deltaproteobacteria bacterium]|nr:hypothetical protein [Deltaproteobacteria bacterium]